MMEQFAYFRNQREKHLEELTKFVSIPSISTQASYRKEGGASCSGGEPVMIKDNYLCISRRWKLFSPCGRKQWAREKSETRIGGFPGWSVLLLFWNRNAFH
jgi:hypothetical protein